MVMRGHDRGRQSGPGRDARHGRSDLAASGTTLALIGRSRSQHGRSELAVRTAIAGVYVSPLVGFARVTEDPKAAGDGVAWTALHSRHLDRVIVPAVRVAPASILAGR